MFRVLVALLVLAAPASAVTRNAAGEFLWSSTTTTSPVNKWGGIGGAATDDHVLDSSDDFVTVTGDVTLTTGTIVCQAGALHVAPGVRLTVPTEMVIEDGCDYRPEGMVVVAGHIAEEVDDFAANAVTITVDFDTTDVDTSGLDYVRYTFDGWPAVGRALGSNVHIGSGAALPGVQRVGYESGRWYRINAKTANTLTYDVDEWLADLNTYSTDGGGDGPYRGTRDNINTAGMAGVTYERGPLGLWTLATVPIGTLGVDADGTDQYLVFPESSVLCSGWHAKILMSLENGASADTLKVAGDVSHCDGNPRITKGARRGDHLEVVRPAVHDGGGTGTIVVLGDGAIQAQHAQFYQLGVTSSGDQSPAVMANYAVVFAESADGDEPDWANTYFRKVDVAFPENDTGGSGIFVLGTGQANINAAVVRFTKRALDMSGMEWSEVYIHDSAGEPTVSDDGGHHGWYTTGADNLHIERARVERINDDGIASSLTHFPTESGAATSVKQSIFEAILADDDNSQECIQYSSPMYGDGATHASLLSAGAVTIEDTLATGCYYAPMCNFPGCKVRRFVGAGNIEVSAATSTFGLGLNSTQSASQHCSSNGVPDACCTGSATGTCDFPDFAAFDNPALINDSVVMIEDILGTSAEWKIHGQVKDSIFSTGMNDAGIQNSWFQGVQKSDGSVWIVDMPAGTASFRFETESATVDLGRVRSFTALDSFFYFLNPTTDWLQEFYEAGDTLNPDAFTMRRSILQINARTTWGVHVDFGANGVGVWDRVTFLNDTPRFTQLDTTASGAGSTVTASCAVTTDDVRTDVFGSIADGTNRVRPVGPYNPQSIPEVIAPADGDVCARARPDKLGIASLGPAHLLLGDPVLHQLRNFGGALSLNLIGSGGSSSGRWPGGAW